MQSRRTHSSRPSISGPFPAEHFIPMSSPTKSPPVTTPRSRPGVMSATLPLARNWLSRSSSSSSASSVLYAPSKPTRISEPQLNSGSRCGALGSGAFIVRTPQDALAGPSVALDNQDVATSGSEERKIADESSPTRNLSPSSPPLPPIPDFEEDEADEAQEDTRSVRSTILCRPTRAIPPTPLDGVPDPMPQRRPSLKSISPPISEYFPPVPALPANLSSSPPQVPFEPILISPPPTSTVDPAKVIVSLETCTMTHRTTLSTLTSRPSLLGSYLKSLLPSQDRDMDDVSVYSDQSDENGAFNSIFHHHLASSGVLSHTSTNIHIFLDRPSAPYAHILTYLRTPPSTPEQPAILPRPVQLSSSSSARLEALLELRDEARYLDLDELYKLCADEIRLRYTNALGLHTHSRGMSSVSVTSSRSLGTLRENAERELEDQQDYALAVRRHSSSRRRKQSEDRRPHSKDSGIGSASPSSLKPPSLESNEHGQLWPSSPPVTAPVSVPGLRERVAMRVRGRSETRKEDITLTKPTGEWI